MMRPLEWVVCVFVVAVGLASLVALVWRPAPPPADPTCRRALADCMTRTSFVTDQLRACAQRHGSADQ